MKVVDGAGLDLNLRGPRRFADPVIFVGRGLMSGLFLFEGYVKISYYQDVAVYMRDYGVSPRLLPLVILTELGGGLSILFGAGMRWAAIALAGYAVLAAALFHNDFADANQVIHFQKNLAISGGFLVLAVLGPGAWSIDVWRARRF